MTEKVTSSIQFTRETMPGAQYYDGKMLKIPITEEAGIQLYKRWFMQGISSIMSSIASQHMSKLNEYERNRVQKCSQAAENINEQARCVIRVIDFKPKQMNFTKMSRIQKLKEHLDMKYKKVNGASVQSSSRHRLVYVKPKMNSEKIIFRTKREVINRQNYKLRTEYDRLTPFGILGKYLTKMTKAIKNKAPHSSWKKTMKAIEIMKRNKEQRHRFFENIEKRLLSDEQVKYFESKLTPEEKDFVEEFHVPNHIIKRLRKNNENAQKTLEIIRLFQRSIKLALILNGANGTKLANKTFIFGSPRLLSLVPNDIQNEIRILSPSILSMHDKGSGLERLTSIPNLLKLTGSKDFEQWLNLFVEASGVSDAIDKIKGDEGHNRLPPGYKSMRRGIDGQPLYFLKENLTEIDPKMIKKVELFENLTLSLTPKQLAEFKITGYSLMTRDQLAMVYGSKSPMSNMKTLEFFLSLNEDQMRDRIIHDIRGLATSKSLVKIRYKRQILQPSALTASILNPGNDITVLSPSALSLTLLSPSVFGLTVLSPELFTATLLSPSVLSPSVLSPKALAPVFLSPSALSPSFLSPVLLSPVFLSPTFLSPRVLSPALLSPAILSPFALNPAIFAPTAYGGIVASPFALSPAIFSPSQNNLVLFSPSIYSPTFNSTGVNNLVLFSPSVGS